MHCVLNVRDVRAKRQGHQTEDLSQSPPLCLSFHFTQGADPSYHIKMLPTLRNTGKHDSWIKYLISEL